MVADNRESKSKFQAVGDCCLACQYQGPPCLEGGTSCAIFLFPLSHSLLKLEVQIHSETIGREPEDVVF